MKMKRKDMKAHEQDDKAHLNKALDTVVELKIISERHLNERSFERKKTTTKFSIHHHSILVIMDTT